MEASSLAQTRLLLPPRRLRALRGEDRLVARIRAGDAAAFDAVFERYHRQILSFCRHMLGQREDAEDAVQHTFLSAYRSLVASEQAIDLRPWLFAIARNRCLSVLRARRPEDRTAERDAEPSVDGLVADVERREDLRDLLADLARLPEDQRAALVLSQLDALSHKEIALVLEVPKEKVKALVFQARGSLASSRLARTTSCGDIRSELATAKGSRLRLGHLRRHLRDCAGCRAFEAEVRLQRGALALLLPVVPSAGLREASLPSSVLSGGAGAGAAGAGAGAAGAGGAAGGGVLSSVAANGVAVKIALAAAVASGSGVSVAAVPAVRDAVTSAVREAPGGEGANDGAARSKARPDAAVAVPGTQPPAASGPAIGGAGDGGDRSGSEERDESTQHDNPNAHGGAGEGSGQAEGGGSAAGPGDDKPGKRLDGLKGKGDGSGNGKGKGNGEGSGTAAPGGGKKGAAEPGERGGSKKDGGSGGAEQGAAKPGGGNANGGGNGTGGGNGNGGGNPDAGVNGNGGAEGNGGGNRNRAGSGNGGGDAGGRGTAIGGRDANPGGGTSPK